MARVLGFLRRLECAEGVINLELGVLLKKGAISGIPERRTLRF
jgi:hypothetical protein